MSLVQLYGQFSGSRSFANISKAFVQALKIGRYPFTISESERLKPEYDVRAEIAINNHAPVGIMVSYPPKAATWLVGHDQKILVTVCETDRIPADWVFACNKVDLIVVPSEFCAEAYRASGVKPPVVVLPHGVGDSFLDSGRELEYPGSQRGVHLLHVSGAASFPARKSTAALLLAFRRIVRSRPDVHLYLKVEPEEKYKAALEELQLERHATILPPQDITAEDMPRFLRQFDAVVQPSRGEGFGIVPLEARCAGVPAVLTRASGHLAHFVRDVDIEVVCGPQRPLQTQGNDAGKAPEVTVEAIEQALRALLADLPGHKARTRAWAARETRSWLWRVLLPPFLAKHVRPHLRSVYVAGARKGVRGLL